MARFPPDVKAWLASEADRYGSSQNAEIVRAVRERMDRMKAVAGGSFQADPATVTHETAFPGGPAT